MCVRAVLSLGVVAATLSVAGCGGGGGDGDDRTTLTIVSRGAIDGVVTSRGNVGSNNAFPQAGSGVLAFLRAIFSFDLSGSVPAGATIVSATLQVNARSSPPAAFAAHGSIVCDHIDLEGLPALDASAFAGLGLTNDFALVTAVAGQGVKSVDVRAAVQADIAAGRTTSSYRLHFTNEVGLDLGVVSFSDGEGTVAGVQPPQLVVTFQE